jgi:hypothetical protein
MNLADICPDSRIRVTFADGCTLALPFLKNKNRRNFRRFSESVRKVMPTDASSMQPFSYLSFHQLRSCNTHSHNQMISGPAFSPFIFERRSNFKTTYNGTQSIYFPCYPGHKMTTPKSFSMKFRFPILYGLIFGLALLICFPLGHLLDVGRNQHNCRDCNNWSFFFHPLSILRDNQNNLCG